MMARFPAPMASWSVIIPTVVDTVFRALADAIPEQVAAGHFGVLGIPVVFFGTDPRTGKRFVTQSIEGGGWGGRPFEDGESGSVSICQGDVRNSPIENMELKVPVLIESGRWKSTRPAPAVTAVDSASASRCAPWPTDAGTLASRAAGLCPHGVFMEAATVGGPTT